MLGDGAPVQIRVAQPGEVKAVRHVAARLDGGVPRQTVKAIEAGSAGALVLAGDHQGLVELLEQVGQGDDLAQDRFHRGVVLPLLAFDRDGALVGGLHAHPPWEVINVAAGRGWPSDVAAMIAAKAVKVGQVWVAPSWRRQGVGHALLARCCDVYFGAGLRVVFGNLRPFPNPAVEAFYRSAGFRVVGGEEGFSLAVQGSVFRLEAEGQGLFYRQRAQWQRERG